MENTYILEMKHISKSFPGVKALVDVDLYVRPGTVHMIMGENGAGKSTLMKILLGLHRQDEGEIYFKGNKMESITPSGALEAGISMIHQELSPIMEFDIAQSIFLGREPMRKGKLFLNNAAIYPETEKQLKKLGLNFDPRRKIKTLSISEMQLVEIAKAVSRGANLIIMDEPTSSLTDSEVAILFTIIRKLRAQGVAIIYITHKMDEIHQIGDEITVMRDGKHIITSMVSDMSSTDIVRMMIGRELTEMYPKEQVEIGKRVLEVRNLSAEKRFKNVNFHVSAGEIVGFAGLVGAGRTEVMRAVFGLDAVESGEILLNEKKLAIKSPSDAIQNGIAMVPEDRGRLGLVKILSIARNLSLPNQDRLAPRFFVHKKQEDREAKELMREFSIKAPDITTQTRQLSGGNQQKVVLAKWFKRGLKVLIMDEPTRGIDVGAKTEIYKLMVRLAKKGYAIIMVSSEMPEILGMSDRIYVMHEGRITGELSRNEATQEKIMRYAVEV